MFSFSIDRYVIGMNYKVLFNFIVSKIYKENGKSTNYCLNHLLY